MSAGRGSRAGRRPRLGRRTRMVVFPVVLLGLLAAGFALAPTPTRRRTVRPQAAGSSRPPRATPPRASARPADRLRSPRARVAVRRRRLPVGAGLGHGSATPNGRRRREARPGRCRSREHRYKKTDIKREFGSGPYHGIAEVVRVVHGQRPQTIRGPGSGGLKFCGLALRVVQRRWKPAVRRRL